VAARPPAHSTRPRYSHAMACDAARNLCVLFGGKVSGRFCNDTWEYDGTAWLPGAAAPSALVQRCEARDGVRLEAQRIVMFGGWGVGRVFNDTWEYDGLSWTSGPRRRQVFGLVRSTPWLRPPVAGV